MLRSCFGLYKAFDEQGIGYAKTAVGDKYVYEYMAKNGCRIGGEQSGHIIFSKYASTGDGILTSLKMMEVMLAKKKPLTMLPVRSMSLRSWRPSRARVTPSNASYADIYFLPSNICNAILMLKILNGGVPYAPSQRK